MLEPEKDLIAGGRPFAKSKDMEDHNVTASSKGDTRRDDRLSFFDDTTRRWERTEEFKLPLGEAGPFEVSEGKWMESDSLNRMYDFTPSDTLSRRRSSASQTTTAGISTSATDNRGALTLSDDNKGVQTENQAAMTQSDDSCSYTPEVATVQVSSIEKNLALKLSSRPGIRLQVPLRGIPLAAGPGTVPHRPALLIFDTTEQNYEEEANECGSSDVKKNTEETTTKMAFPILEAPRKAPVRTPGSVKTEDEFQEKVISGSMIVHPGTRAMPSPDMVVTMAEGLSVVAPGKDNVSGKARDPTYPTYDQAEYHNFVARKRRTIPMRLFLVNLFCAFIMVAFMHYSLLSIFEKRKERGEEKGVVELRERPVCRSIYCKSMGTHLFYVLNTSARPCDSIFDLVCRSWVHESPAKYRRVVLGAQRLYIDNVYTAIYRAMQSMASSSSHNQTSMAKLSSLYRLCLNIQERQSVKVLGFRRLMRRYQLPNWPYTAYYGGIRVGLAQFLRDTGSDAFFRLSWASDGASAEIITIECPTLSLPARSFTEKTADVQIYKMYIRNVLRDLGTPQNVVEDVTTQIVEYETKLARLVVEHCRSYETYQKLPTPPSWDELTRASLQHRARFVNGTLRVQSKDYTLNITKSILESSGDTALANCFGWSVANKLLPSTTTNFIMLHKAFRKELGFEPLSLPMQCLVDVNEVMPLAMGRVFFTEYPRESTSYEAYSMRISLMRALDHDVYRDRWFDEETRGMYTNLRAKMETIFGYPTQLHDDQLMDDYYSSVNVSQSYLEAYVSAASATFQHGFDSSNALNMFGKERFIFPNDVSLLHHRLLQPFYNVRENLFVLPSGVLHPPYYDESVGAAALNFGGLGYLLAHDLVEQLLSNRTDTMWGRLVAKTSASKRQRCLEERIAADVPGIPTQRLAVKVLAARVAFQAYGLHTDFMDDVTLNGLEDMSPEQIFFVALTRTLCSLARTERYTEIVLQKTVVAELSQIDKALLWLPEFRDAFNCSRPTLRHQVALLNSTHGC